MVPEPAAANANNAAPPSSNTAKTEPNVREVVFGNLLIRPWYPSFYPEELIGRHAARLYVCPWCFKYSLELMKFLGHMGLCTCRAGGPPGTEIYRKDGYSLWEVDGEEQKLYAQNLSLFAKLFLDTKSVFYDVTTFLYYMLVSSTPSPVPTTSTSRSTSSHPSSASQEPQRQPPPQQQHQHHQVVGFFSKEKMSWDNNNLACILIFPPWQRKSLGQILMGASYEISKREGRLGGPEKPLSTLGYRAYMRYWQQTLARVLLAVPTSAKKGEAVTVMDLRDETYIVPEDIIASLQEMGVLEKRRGGGGKAVKGEEEVVVNKARVRRWVEGNRVQLRNPVDPGCFVSAEE